MRTVMIFSPSTSAEKTAPKTGMRKPNRLTRPTGNRPSSAVQIVKAAAEGLKNMESPVQVAERRGISVAEMFGGKEN